MTEITLQEGFRRLFAYHEEACPEIRLTKGRFCQFVRVGGTDVPLFSYRVHPKIEGIRKLDVLGKPCALSVSSAGTDSLEEILFQRIRSGGTDSLEEILFRELDAAEYLLDAETDHITAYRTGNSANLIVGFTNGTTAHMQLHSARCGVRQFRHELYTTEGMAADRPVDTVIAQHAINLYTEDGYETYTDGDFLLYGLSQEDQEVVYAVYDAFHGDAQALIRRADRLGRISDAALTKGRSCRRGEDF